MLRDKCPVCFVVFSKKLRLFLGCSIHCTCFGERNEHSSGRPESEALGYPLVPSSVFWKIFLAFFCSDSLTIRSRQNQSMHAVHKLDFVEIEQQADGYIEQFHVAQ